MSEVEPVGTPETEQAKGLDAIISGAMDEAKFGEEAPKVETPVEKPAEEEKTAAEIKADSTGRLHKADGKFATKDKPEATTSPKGQVAAPVNGTAKPEGVTAETQQVAIPDAWSPEWKAKVATLAPEQQQLMVDQYKAMQGDYTKSKQELAEQRKQQEPLLAEANKWTPYFQQIGMTPDKALSSLAQFEYKLRTGTPEQKQAMLDQLAQDYGLTQPTGQNGQPLDPAFTQLHQTVAGLQHRLRTYEQQQEQTETQRILSDVQAFSQSKDQSGALQYPHFERVRQAMGQLIGKGITDNLPDAYKLAVRQDDELFQQTIESERKHALDETEKARQEAVEKAKKAGPIRSSDGSPKGSSSVKGLDAHLDVALERFTSA